MLNVKQGRAIEVKSVSETGAIMGYGSTFGEMDRGYDVMEKGAFAKSLEQRTPKMLWGHDFKEPPIGNWVDAKEDDHGLLLRGQINLDMQKGREVHSALKNKSVDGLSVGFIDIVSEISEAGVRHIKEVELFEVSVVTFPMNESARVDAVKALVDSGQITKRQMEGLLRDVGLSVKQAKALLAGGFDELVSRDEHDDVNWTDVVGHISTLMRTKP